MIRNLKALGLALVAVFAMSAVAASAAQATNGTFSWDPSTTGFTVEADPSTPSQLFTVKTKTNATVESTCDEVSANLNLPEGTSSETLTATEIVYSDSGTTPTENACTGHLGEVEEVSQVNMHGCHYKFHAGTTVGSMENMETEGTADIVCPEGVAGVTVTAGTCTVTVPPQEGVGPVFYRTATTPNTQEREEGKREDVTVEARIGEEIGGVQTAHYNPITYNTSGFPCGSQTGRHDGTYTGTVTVKGHDSIGNLTDVTVT
jgi:hypothetical protein